MLRSPSVSWSLALASCLFACKGEPPAYLHTVYVEALDSSVAGRARLRVRLVQADGEPAPPPDSRSVIPVAGDRGLARSMAWTPVSAADVSVVVVSDPGLDDVGRKAEAAIHASLQGAAGAIHEVAAGDSTGAPMPLPGGTRAKAPVAALERAFSWQEARPEGGRRVVIASVTGNASGRIWTRMAARSLAAGADLIVLAFVRPGRAAPRPRAVHPLFVFPVDPAADLTPVIDALGEAVGGGMWAEFDTDRTPVQVATGLALRAKLPRGGWEDFALAPVETAALRVVVDSIRPASEGMCRVGLRVVDAASRPVRVQAGEVAFVAGGVELTPSPPDAAARRSAVVIIDPYLRDGPALRQLTDAALAGLSPNDVAAVFQAGPTAGEVEPPSLRPVREVLAEAASLKPSPVGAQVDLFAHLEEVERRLGAAIDETAGGASLIVLSGLHPVRAVESVGSPSPRLGSALTKWRRRGVVPVWAVLSPAAELRRFPLALARLGGLGVAGRDVARVSERLKKALAGRHADHHANLPCPAGVEALSESLEVRAVRRGRTSVGAFRP